MKPPSPKKETSKFDSTFDDVLLGLCLAAALLIGLKFVNYAYDDAYITYRYAQNLSLGHGFVYNLGQDFLGTTTPLYSLILAASSLLLPIPIASGILSLCSLLGSILLIEVLGRQSKIRFAGSLASLFLFTEPQIYQIFGGETLLVYFLLVPAGLTLHQGGYRGLAAITFGLAILGRMDAVIFVALVYGVDTLRRRQLPIKEGLLIAVLLLPWFLYSMTVFGQLFPATMATKMAMGASGAWKLFGPGSQIYLYELNPYQGLWAPAFVLLLLLGVWRSLFKERVWLFFLGNSLLFAAIYQWILASAFSHWYLAPLYFSHALLLGAGIRQIWTLFQNPFPDARRRIRINGLPTLVRVVFIALIITVVTQGFRGTRTFDTQPPRRELYTEVGRWLNNHTRSDESVTYYEIGYLGWFSDRTIIDPVGLVTPGGLESIRQGRLHWVVDRYSPDYFIHNSRNGRDPILSTSAFRSRYKPVKRFQVADYPGELEIFQRLR